jgi:hypothetical protein
MLSAGARVKRWHKLFHSEACASCMETSIEVDYFG